MPRPDDPPPPPRPLTTVPSRTARRRAEAAPGEPQPTVEAAPVSTPASPVVPPPVPAETLVVAPPPVVISVAPVVAPPPAPVDKLVVAAPPPVVVSVPPVSPAPSVAEPLTPDPTPAQPPTPNPQPPAPNPLRRLWPLLGGSGGLLLAAAGEWLVEGTNKTPLSLLLFLAGIALFAWSAWPLPPQPADVPGEPDVSPPAARRRWPLVAVGLIGAIVLNGSGGLLIQQNRGSIPGAWLWLASLVVLIVTGGVAGGLGGWAVRWGARVLPSTPRGRLLFFVVLGGILVVAAAARLLALDSVPFGINADEGDRGALAIQVVRGENNTPIFGFGWYYISMFYFWVLAAVMKVVGIGYVGARVLGALAGIGTVALVTWIGVRHWGWRVGALAGGLGALMAVVLQFSRETSESGPTAFLWTASMACFMEAARRGRAWAWIVAGLSGGLSIYFYPTGRLWAVLAVLTCGYLLLHGLGGQRRAVLRGTALAALAALMVMAPYLLQLSQPVDRALFTLRAEQTSVFSGDNPTRLSYYQPSWNTAQLLAAQVDRSIGVFNQYHDDGGFWPSDRPLMNGLLAVLTLLGLGWIFTRPRDPRMSLLALWFSVGIVGMVITVETPNLQRMTGAIPLLPLLPALVLDSLARRVDLALVADKVRASAARFPLQWVTTGGAALLIGGLSLGQGQFYFGQYGAMDRWPQPSGLGWAVQGQGPGTQTVSLARQYHMINSGWVRLMAPYTPRAGIQAPGSSLPLAQPADHALTFFLWPQQAAYLPYLQSLYPDGHTTPYQHPTEHLMFTTYAVTQAQWVATQGALAGPPGGPAVQVPTLGAPPPGLTSYPSPMRWTAAWRVPQYWNYSIEVGPGPAHLTIDGQDVLTVPAGTTTLSTTLALARGDHAVVYDGTLAAAGEAARFAWAAQPDANDAPGTALVWQPVAAHELRPTAAPVGGLYGVVRIEGGERAEQHRLDNTLATCCLLGQVRSDGKPFTITWTGEISAPVGGVYSMTLVTQGATDLQIAGQPVIHTDGPAEQGANGSVTLQAGPQPVTLTYASRADPGWLEWTWTPPDGITSILPPSALAPPPGVSVGPPASLDTLGLRTFQPVDRPVETVP